MRSYTYDAENRLKIIKTENKAASYKYDGLGRKVYAVECHSIGNGGYYSQLDYIYDGWNVVLDFSPDEIENSYIWGLDLSGTLQGAGGVGGLLSVESPFEGGTGGCYFFCYDGNGNVINLIDIDTKEIAAHYEYDPFGRLLEKEGSFADENLYRFSTKRFDKTFGLYYYGYRFYSPDLGRFINCDPIGEKGGLNLYGFVLNNPISGIDPFGLECMCGANITKSLKALKRKIEKRFYAASPEARTKGCTQYTQKISGNGNNWDLEFDNKAKGCPTGKKCQETVTVNGKCHNKWEVNYLLYGTIFRLCNEHSSYKEIKRMRSHGMSSPGDHREAISLGFSTASAHINMRSRMFGWKVIKMFTNEEEGYNPENKRDKIYGSPDSMYEWSSTMTYWADEGFSGNSNFKSAPQNRVYKDCKPAKSSQRGKVNIQTMLW